MDCCVSGIGCEKESCVIITLSQPKGVNNESMKVPACVCGAPCRTTLVPAQAVKLVFTVTGKHGVAQPEASKVYDWVQAPSPI